MFLFTFFFMYSFSCFGPIHFVVFKRFSFCVQIVFSIKVQPIENLVAQTIIVESTFFLPFLLYPHFGTLFLDCCTSSSSLSSSFSLSDVIRTIQIHQHANGHKNLTTVLPGTAIRRALA